MVLLNRYTLTRVLWIAAMVGISGCGSQPTIPVEEHSSIKPPKQREIYYRAAPVARPSAPVAITPRQQHKPITYEAVEPEPVWQEVPPPQQQPRTAPAPRKHYREPVRTTIIEPAPREDNPLLGMVQKIEHAMQQGEFEQAEGLLERALRIDSQRPGLWHDLAQVRYQQHAYQEAVTLARRSNSFANPGSVLKEENWSLIARSKEALGDLDGARAAWRKAGR